MEMEQDTDWYVNSSANDKQGREDGASPTQIRDNTSIGNDDLELTRHFGLNPTTQVAKMGNYEVCYVLYKPVGWTILGDNTLKKKNVAVRITMYQEP